MSSSAEVISEFSELQTANKCQYKSHMSEIFKLYQLSLTGVYTALTSAKIT